MQNNNYIKSFPCTLHPSESIQRISTEPNVDDPLKCIECIVDSSASKDYLLPFDDFIERVIRQYQKLPQQIPLTKSSPPHELIEFLAQKEEKISRLAKHINGEKEKVNFAFNSLIIEFTKICQSRKQELTNQLDQQLETLKLNYQYYRSKINKYFNSQNDFCVKSQEEMIEKINNCLDTSHLESLVNNIKEDLLEYDRKLPTQKIFNCLANGLQQQAEFLPQSQFCNESIETLNSELREMTNSLLKNYTSIEPKISSLSFVNSLSLDSQLVQKQDERYLLKKWLAPDHEDIDLKLLFRGSRDGLNLVAFHERCDNYPLTLTIAKSSFGKILGGFSDQPWSYFAASPEYKKSEKAFLFSITEKQKFPIRPDQVADAIHAGADYGPTFGAGHDLLLYFNENLPSEHYACYSLLGRTYRCNPENPSTEVTSESFFLEQGRYDKTILAGGERFHVEEVEVYSVETIKD